MIKLIDLLKELNIRKKTPVGSGWQQSIYPYLKNPNYVIKKFDNKSDQHTINRYEIKHYLEMLKLYPEYIANIIIPKENSKYYFQEKVDVKKAQEDIWNVVIKVIKEVASDLKNKYKTPHDAANSGDFKNIELFWNAESWEDIENINNIDDVFDILQGEGIPMKYLFNKYIYNNYSKNIPLVQKLNPVYAAGIDATTFGEFHEDNLGYDKNGNFKIIDI